MSRDGFANPACVSVCVSECVLAHVRSETDDVAQH